MPAGYARAAAPVGSRRGRQGTWRPAHDSGERVGTGRIRGVHAYADGAGEIITAAVYAIRAQMTVSGLADTWAPYLTMSEALRLAAQSFGRDVTKLSCCAH
jgi:pyruvate/2-oxoglutarate dehydrogenase complex dihydrolipoamide dehydrogenase (E3) component